MKLRNSILAGAMLLSLACPLPHAALMAQYTLNVRDADIRAFIQDAARVTGRTFIIDGRVNGKVSVVTDRPLSRSEYFEIFLSTLRANGLIAVPTTGGAYRVQPVAGAATEPGRVGAGASRNQFVTEIFRLRSIDAASAMETLRPVVSKDGSVSANRAGNSLVVADYADNVARIREIIRRIDRDASSTRLITLQNAGAREVASSLQTLMGGANGQGVAAATVVAIDSSNSIAIRGDASSVERLAAMAQELDRKAASGTEVRVYWLNYADAEALLPVLQQLVGQPAMGGATGGGAQAGGDGARAAAPAPVFSTSGTGIATRGPAVVTRYEGANAVIIAASADVQKMLGETIRQLDTRRDQVLVEAIIVEISDNAARKLGVQFLLGDKNVGFAATNYSNVAPNLLTLAGAYGADRLGTTKTTVVAPDGTRTTTETQTNSDLANTLQQAAVDSLANATGGFGGVATQLGRNGFLAAIVNAVRSDTDSNILSTPSVMTLDNQKASLLVGQEVPVTTGEALSQNFDNQFRTVQRQNVGIQLEVKPQINAGGAIKLFLRQEVSSVAGPVSNDSSDLIINKREIETTVTVDDGDIVALGGLLDDNERRTIERIPLLSDIPGIGELFKSRSRARTKTNLMVFIRPTVLRSREDAERVAAMRYGYVRSAQLARNPDQEPALDTLVRDYMGTTPPVAAPQPGDVTVDGAQPLQPVDLPPSGAAQ